MAETADDLTAASAWFASALDFLFVTLRVPGGPKITNVAAAEHVTRYTGESCSDSYIGILRNAQPGDRLNPKMSILLGIADFFRITPAYFIDPDYGAKIQAAIKVIVAIRDAGPRRDAVLSDVTAVLNQTTSPVTPAALAQAAGLPPHEVAALDHTLSRAGGSALSPPGGRRRTRRTGTPADTVDDSPEADLVLMPSLRHAEQALRRVATEMTTEQLEALAGLLRAFTPQIRADLSAVPALNHAAQALRKVAAEMTTEQLEALAGLLEAFTPQIRADQIATLADVVRSFGRSSP